MGQALLLKNGGMNRVSSNIEYTYSGQYTDETKDGIRTISLLTSGTLEVLSGEVGTSVYILGGGGGGAWLKKYSTIGAGGGGGNQTVPITLSQGTYEIVIGAGGNGKNETDTMVTEAYGTSGGSTSAFGYTSTGGSYGQATNAGYGGAGGTPDGGKGEGFMDKANASGGFPNGGSVVNYSGQDGGSGIVKISWRVAA